MKRTHTLPKSLLLIVIMSLATAAVAQKPGGVLRRANDENPPSASLHEEGSNVVTTPFVPVFNNLVDFDPTKSLSRPEAIVPDLAASWSWSADHKTLTFKHSSRVIPTCTRRARPCSPKSRRSCLTRYARLA